MIDLTHLHPMVVHFPIAILLTGFIAELAGAIFRKEFFSRAALWMLAAGTAGVIAAYFTGQAAGDGMTEAGPLKTALESHESAARFAMWVMAGVAIVRIALVLLKRFKGSLRWVAVALYFAGTLTIVQAGHRGGELVYKHGAGVELDIELDPAPGSESSPSDSSSVTPEQRGPGESQN